MPEEEEVPQDEDDELDDDPGAPAPGTKQQEDSSWREDDLGDGVGQSGGEPAVLAAMALVSGKKLEGKTTEGVAAERSGGRGTRFCSKEGKSRHRGSWKKTRFLRDLGTEEDSKELGFR
jgi:hypothetical protein